MHSRKASRSPISAAHQQAYELFETVRLAADEALLKRFVFLLGAERVVPAHRECHLYELLRASETVGRELTNQFYALYADIRQRVLTRLCRENGSVEMLVTELHRAVPALLDELSRQGAPLTELRTHSASLEDVFVTLTGRHLRDE